MKKKVYGLFLAVPLLTALTACGANPGSSNGDSGLSGSQTSSESNRDPDQVSLKPDEYDQNGRLKVSFFGIDLDDLQSQTDDTKMIVDYVQKKFNVSFNYINGSATSWDTILSQNIGVDDCPDVFFHDAYEPSYSSWLKDHYLFNYDRYIDQYPNLKKAFDLFPQDRLKTYLGGDLYSLPIALDNTIEGGVTNAHSIYYRRDWYTSLKNKGWQPSSGRGLIDPEDPNFSYLNWYDLLEGFTKGDPDGNGSNDTYGYIMTKDGGTYWWYPLLSMFNVQPDGWHYNDATKLYEPDNTSDDMKEALMWISDMFDKGFINTNYATTCTQSQMKNEFVNGQGGMMVFNSGTAQVAGICDLMQSYASGKDMINVVRGLPTPTNKYGNKTMFGHKNNYGFRAICNDLSVHKKRVILSLMDWMLSDEGQTMMHYGIEGVHYDLVDGKIVSKLGKDKTGYDKSLSSPDVAPGIYRLNGLVSWYQPLPNEYKYQDVHQQMLAAFAKKDLVLDPLAYANPGQDFAITSSNLKDLAETNFKNIVSKTTNDKRESTWTAFVKKYNTTGSSYINAMNDSAEGWGK